MTQPLHQPLGTFFDDIALRQPTPGGGAVAASVAAHAVALARMVVAYSIGKKTEAAKRERLEKLAARLEELDGLLRSLIAEDMAAYSHMANVAKARRKGECEPEEAISAALTATAVPVQIAAITAEALGLFAAALGDLNMNLRGDVAVVRHLADGAVSAAVSLARLNIDEELAAEPLTRKLMAEMTEATSRVDRFAESIDKALVQE